jgi:hypothetical protein
MGRSNFSIHLVYSLSERRRDFEVRVSCPLTVLLVLLDDLSFLSFRGERLVVDAFVPSLFSLCETPLFSVAQENSDVTSCERAATHSMARSNFWGKNFPTVWAVLACCVHKSVSDAGRDKNPPNGLSTVTIVCCPTLRICFITTD